MSAKAGIHIFFRYSIQQSSYFKTAPRRQQNCQVLPGGNTGERIIAWLVKKWATSVCKLCLSVSVGQIAGAARFCALNKIVTNMELENGIETYLPFRQKNTTSASKDQLLLQLIKTQSRWFRLSVEIRNCLFAITNPLEIWVGGGVDWKELVVV